MAGRSVEAGSAFVRLFVKNGELMKGLAAAKSRLNAFASTASIAGGAMMAGGAAIGAPIAASLRTFATFEDQMAAVGAVSRASEAELAAMTEQAKLLGRTTSFTATQIAALQTELGRAGFSPQEIIESTTAIQNLGRATGTDLAEAARIAGAALRQFSLPTSDATRVADVLTAAANNSATTVLELGDAFNYVGPVATDAGMSIEDTAKALGVLANLGLKGSMGGTGLRRALLAFADPKVQEQLKGLGVEALTAEGNLRPIADIFLDVGRATEKLPNAERLALFQGMFDLRGMTAGMKLSGSVDEMVRMSAAIDAAGGAAATTAAKMDNTLGGTFRRIMSAVEGVAISVGEAMAPAFRNVEVRVTDALAWVTKFVEQNEYLIPVVAGVAAGMIGFGAGLLGLAAAAKIAAIGIGIAQMAIAALNAVITVGGWIASFSTFVALSPVILGILLGIAGGMAQLAAIQFTTGFFDDLLGSAQSTANYIGGQFMQSWAAMKDVAGETIAGITQALQSGDLKGAIDVAMAGMQAALAAGFVPMVTMWEDFKLGVIETMIGMSVQVKEVFLEMMKGLAFQVPGAGLLLNDKINALEEDMRNASGAVMNTAAQMRREAIGRWQGAADEAINAINAPAMQRTQDAWNEILGPAGAKGGDGAGLMYQVGDTRDLAPEAPDELFTGGTRPKTGRDYGPAEALPRLPREPDATSNRLLELPRTLDEFARMQSPSIPKELTGGTSGTFSAAAALALGGGTSAAERTAKATERTAKAAEQTAVNTKDQGGFQ